jgi:hypothetical protein
MSEHSFDSIVNDPLVLEALPYLPPLPFIGSGTTSAGMGIVPAEILGEILGVRPDLGNRQALIAAIERAFPLQKDGNGKTVVVYRPATAEMVTMPRANWPLVGPTATAAVALQTLVQHLPALQQIRPLDPSSVDADEYESLIDLIRGAIERLAQQFAGGQPVPQEIDATLFTLCGWKRDDLNTFPASPEELDGYLGLLEERCGLDAAQMHSVDDEKVYTNFANVVALTGIFARAWEDVHAAGGPVFFLDTIHGLHRHLYGVVAAATELRSRVSPSAWTTIDVPTEPPLPSGQLMAWTLRAAGTTALEMLKKGRDGLSGVHEMMKAIRSAWVTLHERDASQTGTGYCAGVPGAFEDDETQEVLHQLLCHLDRVIDATDQSKAYTHQKRDRNPYADREQSESAPALKQEQQSQSAAAPKEEQQQDESAARRPYGKAPKQGDRSKT